MHKQSCVTGNCVFSELPDGDITPIKSLVTITLDEYRELVKSKAVADALLIVILSKLKEGYGGIKYEELELLAILYGKKEGHNGEPLSD